MSDYEIIVDAEGAWSVSPVDRSYPRKEAHGNVWDPVVARRCAEAVLDVLEPPPGDVGPAVEKVVGLLLLDLAIRPKRRALDATISDGWRQHWRGERSRSLATIRSLIAAIRILRKAGGGNG